LGINRNSIEEYFPIVAEFVDGKRRCISGDSRANLSLTQNGQRRTTRDDTL